MKNLLLKIAFATILTSIGSVAMAASFDSWHTAERSNTAGITTKVLPPHSAHFCYLSRVVVEDTDTSNEEAECNVVRSGTVWILEARLGKSSDADVRCAAYCYNR
ncbi:hypothetical protein P886_4686 [Alteromonadaceae bacterium 2753L.S.0a.02]|nr:hypothetical protein P886_4686 [Alteromonadaceae bacterium 2753L.S.0a.02]